MDEIVGISNKFWHDRSVCNFYRVGSLIVKYMFLDEIDKISKKIWHYNFFPKKKFVPFDKVIQLSKKKLLSSSILITLTFIETSYKFFKKKIIYFLLVELMEIELRLKKIATFRIQLNKF